MMLTPDAVAAEQATSGELGSSDAITTIDRNYLPLSPSNFGGVIPTPARIVIVQSICA
jgi:hypothetical protein